ncbi:MAG: VWA domain-containing protein [Cocleimonas sp.]
MNILSIINTLEWRQPLWLLLALQPLILWLLVRFKNSRESNQFADKHLLPWVQISDQKSFSQKIFSRDTAYWLSMILLAIAMAGPRTPLESADAKQASALDIMLVVDVSASMKATDIEPSRLQRGVQELHELLTRIKRDDVRFGSIVYAARPHVFVPITHDLDALKFYLKDLNQLVLPTKGSDASAALLMAGKALQSLKSTDKNSGKSMEKQAKAILWLTDGDVTNTQEKSQLESTLRSLQKQNIPTFILGLGTAEGSEIPLRKGGWLEHNGQGVISKMDAGLLADFAKLAGGKFSKTYDDESEWESLYSRGLLSSVVGDLKAPSKAEDQQWTVYYPCFLFAGLILLLLSLVPFTFVKKRADKQTQSITSYVLSAVLLGFLLSPTSEVYADEQALNSVLEESVKNYNNQEYALATSGFMSIILNAESDSDRGKAMHNLGNNYFQQGDYENASQLFEDALRYAPDQKQSQNNLILTSELNTLLKRRTTRGAATNANQTTGRDQFGNQNQVATMLESRVSKSKNLNLPEIPKEHLNNLLSKGLAHLQMLDSTEAIEKRQKQRNIEQARISLLRDQDSSLDMWKRLFEIEEGFPAKLDSPKTVPGQKPW